MYYFIDAPSQRLITIKPWYFKHDGTVITSMRTQDIKVTIHKHLLRL